jgi:hypothetical protein
MSRGSRWFDEVGLAVGSSRFQVQGSKLKAATLVVLAAIANNDRNYPGISEINMEINDLRGFRPSV